MESLPARSERTLGIAPLRPRETTGTAKVPRERRIPSYNPLRGLRPFLLRSRPFGAILAGLGIALAGCQAVPTAEQGRVAKPNMVFSDTAVFSYESGLVAQVEPGAAVSGGAAAAGCTSCK